MRRPLDLLKEDKTIWYSTKTLLELLQWDILCLNEKTFGSSLRRPFSLLFEGVLCLRIYYWSSVRRYFGILTEDLWAFYKKIFVSSMTLYEKTVWPFKIRFFDHFREGLLLFIEKAIWSYKRRLSWYVWKDLRV